MMFDGGGKKATKYPNIHSALFLSLLPSFFICLSLSGMSLDCLTAGAEQENLKKSFFLFVCLFHFFPVSFFFISEEQTELVMSLGGVGVSGLVNRDSSHATDANQRSHSINLFW